MNYRSLSIPFFKALTAELRGIFAPIFIDAGAVVAIDPGNLAAVALAHGFVIMAFAYAFGHESNSYGVAGRFASFAIGMAVAFCIMGFGSVTGASINPARTLGADAGALRLTEAVPYMAAQFVGATLAALVYGFIFIKKIGDEKVAVGADAPAF